jgi:hypothetical protein
MKDTEERAAPKGLAVGMGFFLKDLLPPFSVPVRHVFLVHRLHLGREKAPQLKSVFRQKGERGSWRGAGSNFLFLDSLHL